MILKAKLWALYDMLLSIDFMFYFNNSTYLCNLLLLLLCIQSLLWVNNLIDQSFIMNMICIKKDWINYLLIFILLSFPSQTFYDNKVHQIFVWNIFLGVSSYDIMCNCDITGSSFSENMASLKRLLRLNKRSKHERKVNFPSFNFY